MTSFDEVKHTMPSLDIEQQQQPHFMFELEDKLNYSQRGQWLRAAVLGANDGLVSTGSIMMGVGAFKQDVKAMILTGFAGLVAGAFSMAIGEFVSVYSQLDIEVAQKKRDNERNLHNNNDEQGGRCVEEAKTKSMPNPFQAALASLAAFVTGAMLPLLAASFIRDYKIRLRVVATTVTVALMVFGWLGAILGKAPPLRSSIRVLVGGWLAMGVTFGLTKFIDSTAFHSNA